MTKLKVTVNDTINCKPDTATIDMSISAVMSSMEDLNKYYNDILDRLKKTLHEFGMSESDLVLGKLNFSKKFKSVKHESKNPFSIGSTTYYDNEFDGYSLNTKLSYATDIDNSQISKLYIKLLGFKEINSSLSFSCEDLESYKDELLENLMLKARHKADIIADVSGLEVEGVIDVDYSVSSVNICYNNYNTDFDYGGDACEDSICDLIDEADKLGQDISDSITVTFSLV